MEGGHWNRSIWMKLNDLRKKGIACDIELIPDDGEQQYPAHLCILAASSPHLKSQLQGVADINRATVIRLSEFSCRVLEAVLEFMYTGCLAFEADPISEVEKAAKVLQIKELQMLCSKISKKQKVMSAESEQFIMIENASWNKNVWYNLNLLRMQKQFCNLTLELDDSNSFEAHACLLMAASSYFRKNLPVEKIEGGVSVCLQLEALEISSTVMQAILDYIYIGSLSIALKDLKPLYDFATILKMEELMCLLTSLQSKHKSLKTYEQEVSIDAGSEQVMDTTDKNVTRNQVQPQVTPLNSTKISGQKNAKELGELKHESRNRVSPNQPQDHKSTHRHNQNLSPSDMETEDQIMVKSETVAQTISSQTDILVQSQSTQREIMLQSQTTQNELATQSVQNDTVSVSQNSEIIQNLSALSPQQKQHFLKENTDFKIIHSSGQEVKIIQIDGQELSLLTDSVPVTSADVQVIDQAVVGLVDASSELTFLGEDLNSAGEGQQVFVAEGEEADESDMPEVGTEIFRLVCRFNKFH